ncbi:hypothetical protein HD597_005334 [Nonomuraea thailandensis]|uniref:Pentapeptide repeat-containing protein n=1 Tax=Nonomuraea thailandensis TaxID=1188745 RepID=A0A9X2K3F7_9ACTN|nr:hypothetical protein [Nonomuraea thailandensis]MCP2358314.1 hypothetical protein [Nonomuraea thailandensis]
MFGTTTFIDVAFIEATFNSGTTFGWATFTGFAFFDGAAFSGDAGFEGATGLEGAKLHDVRIAPAEVERRWPAAWREEPSVDGWRTLRLAAEPSGGPEDSGG